MFWANIVKVHPHVMQWYSEIFCTIPMVTHHNRHVAHIPECTSLVSHNALFCNGNVHMCAHFCYRMVHCDIFVWCIVGFVRWVYCSGSSLALRREIANPIAISALAAMWSLDNTAFFRHNITSGKSPHVRQICFAIHWIMIDSIEKISLRVLIYHIYIYTYMHHVYLLTSGKKINTQILRWIYDECF